MGWTAKVKNSVSYADMTTENAALAYKITWEMNKPASMELLVNDDSGAKTQTYGSAYMGKSAILIEQPTNTEIFRGRIIAAESNVGSGLLTLRGEDWLGQLKDRLVNYDTREILDPNDTNSLRESQLIPYRNAGTRCNAITEAAGDSEIWIEYEDIGANAHWDTDAYNGMKLCFPYTYIGQQTDKCYAYNEVVTPAMGAMDTDTPANGETYTWAADDAVHAMSNSDAAGVGDFTVEYYFHTLAIDSALVDSIDNVKLSLTYKVYGAELRRMYIILYDYTAAGYAIKLYESGVGNTLDAMDEYETKTFTVAGSNLADVIDADGDMLVKIGVLSEAGVNKTCSLNVDEIYFEIDYTVDTALTSQYTIDDTVRVLTSYNYLSLAGDTLVTDGICDWWYYYITDEVTAYVTDLVTTYDELYAIDASTSVTASTNYTGRHYHRMQPLKILQNLAQVDGTDFWLEAWDGDSLDLVWNSTYATGGAPNWTDSSVLSWMDLRQALHDVTNEWFIEGYTSGDYKATGSDTDAGSIAAYGRRSALFNNPDIGSDIECDNEADARVNRTHDLPFHLACVMNGYNTTVLGTVIEVDSTKLGLTDQYYIVTRKEYDSRSALTTFFLTPREGTDYTLNPRKLIDSMGRDIFTRIDALESRMERGGRYTRSW